MSGDAALPAPQRVGFDEPGDTSWPGERNCDHAEQAPVVIGEVGAIDLSAEHTELVAQDDDLEVLAAA